MRQRAHTRQECEAADSMHRQAEVLYKTCLLAARVRLPTVAPRMTRRGSPCPLYARPAVREGRVKVPAEQEARWTLLFSHRSLETQ